MAKSGGRLAALEMDQPGEDRQEDLERLQDKMLRIQEAYFHEGRRGIVVFEGWDAAGKGGAIRRLTSRLDPRSLKVWPIGVPDPVEQGKHYLYRFWQRLPERGHIAVFDRSWYGRVLVERVEGFAKKADWQRAYGEIDEFEKMLTDDGVRVVKVFLYITQEEQLKRFVARLKTPEKHWKITLDDLRNREKWTDYVEAAEEMFDRTDTPNAPWRLIAANQKPQARVAVLREVTDLLGEGVKLAPPPVDPEMLKAAEKLLGVKIR